jgi:hypothetical protein
VRTGVPEKLVEGRVGNLHSATFRPDAGILRLNKTIANIGTFN